MEKTQYLLDLTEAAERQPHNHDIRAILSRRRALRKTCLLRGAADYHKGLLDYNPDADPYTSQVAYVVNVLSWKYRPDRKPSDRELSALLRRYSAEPLPPILMSAWYDARGSELSIVAALEQVGLPAPTWYRILKGGTPRGSTKIRILTMMYLYGFDPDETTAEGIFRP